MGYGGQGNASTDINPQVVQQILQALQQPQGDWSPILGTPLGQYQPQRFMPTEPGQGGAWPYVSTTPNGPFNSLGLEMGQRTGAAQRSPHDNPALWDRALNHNAWDSWLKSAPASGNIEDRRGDAPINAEQTRSEWLKKLLEVEGPYVEDPYGP